MHAPQNPQSPAETETTPAGRRLWRLPEALPHGLGIRLLLIVVIVSLLGMVTSAVLTLALQREQLISSARTASDRLGSAIEASLMHAMLTNDRDMIAQILLSVAHRESVQTIAILGADGMVKASSVPDDLGQVCSWFRTSCGSVPSVVIFPKDGTAIRKDAAGQDVLLNVTPIRNERRCYKCHDAQETVLGALLIERPLKDVNDQLAAGLSRLLLPGLATFALLVGLLVPALNHLITRPVHALSKRALEIGRGNLSYPVSIGRDDELRQLAEAFDTMCEQLLSSRSEMELRRRELALLNDVAMAAGQLLDLQPILELALDTVIRGLDLRAGAVFLHDRTGDAVALCAYRRLSEAQASALAAWAQGQGGDNLQALLDRGQSALISGPAQLDEPLAGLCRTLDAQTCASLPVRAKGAAFGVLMLFDSPQHALSGRELSVLEAVGSEIGIAIDNAMLLADTRQHEQEAVALYHLGSRISASLELSEVLQAIADGARELLHTDIGLVGLRDEDQDDIVVRAVAGEDVTPFQGCRVSLAEGAWGHALAAGQPVLGDTCPWNQAEGGPIAPEHRSCLAVPLVRGERTLGLIGVVSCERRHFTQADAGVLTRLTHQVVIAIENARLYRQVHYLAILEERDRLGREMHDNLAQSLGYINLKSSITQHLLAKGQVEEAEASLRELKEVVQESYTDVREVIFSLRTAASLRTGLLPMLRDYLLEYRAHCGVDAQLDMEDQSLADFSDETRIQVARIVQEALTNTRKHAGATKAWVRFAGEDGFIHITIKDNGCGFNPSTISVQGGHFLGLQIMRERAESVGGRLVIESQPGEGTRVHIFVPRAV